MTDIKECRAYVHMTQKQFAEFIGIPLRTLQNWESGKTKIRPVLLQSISDKCMNLYRKEK